MADQSVRGRFVWHELMTSDSNAAHAFYSKAIGWKSQPWEEDSSYVMFATPRGPIGATVTAEAGTAPNWLPYIGTGDIEKTVAQVQQKGGSVVKEIDTLSSGSKYAVLQDPYGASFGVYESADDYGQITEPQPGEHSWHELMSTDYAGAFAFYSGLFGWQKIDQHDMGDMGVYLIWGLNGRPLGGMMNVMNGGPSPAWVSYVRVKDVNQTAKKAKSAGGKVINGPMEVPGGDWIVQVVDPQGAMFAAHATAASMKSRSKTGSKLSAAETPPPVTEESEVPPVDEAPPAAPEQKAPAKKAPAKKAPAQEAPADQAPSEPAPAKQAPAKKAPAKKAPARKKAPAKKAPAKKSPAKSPAKKKAGKKKRPAAKGAGSKKTAAKKSAKKGAKKASKKVKTRSGGNKKAAKKPRKGK